MYSRLKILFLFANLLVFTSCKTWQGTQLASEVDNPSIFYQYCEQLGKNPDEVDKAIAPNADILETTRKFVEYARTRLIKERNYSDATLDEAGCQQLPRVYQDNFSDLVWENTDVRHIAGFPQLLIKSLRITNANLKDRDVEGIVERFYQLEHLDLSGNLELKSCKHLSSFGSYIDLRIENTSIAMSDGACSPDGGRFFKRLKNLDISNTKVGMVFFSEFDYVDDFKELLGLRLSGLYEKNEKLVLNVKQFPNLRALDLSGSSIELTNLDAGLPALRYLDVRGRRDAQELISASPNLEYLVTSNGTELRIESKKLKGFYSIPLITRSTDYTTKPSGNIDISQLVADKPNLKEIDLSGHPSAKIPAQDKYPNIKIMNSEAVNGNADFYFGTGEIGARYRKIYDEVIFGDRQ